MARRDPIFSPDAVRQLKKLRAFDQRAILDGVRQHLVEGDPAEKTRNKFRLRRMSEVADYELRLGELRVFYRITIHEVIVTVIGVKKSGKLLVEGKEFEV